MFYILQESQTESEDQEFFGNKQERDDVADMGGDDRVPAAELYEIPFDVQVDD